MYRGYNSRDNGKENGNYRDSNYRDSANWAR